MGNSLITPCFHASHGRTAARLIFVGGGTRLLFGRELSAGELMFQFPDCVVCHAGSFYIGQPIPALSMDDELLAGETYFVLPADRLPCHSTLTAASLALLSSSSSACPRPPLPRLFSTRSGEPCPFEYVKGCDGRALIKVLPEFIARIISNGGGGGMMSGEICSTPELRKHYEQLVGTRSQPWSPSLATITEKKGRTSSSPSRLLGFDRR
ncbi:hypothetical protein AXF42_Ash004501 [Apostasia shenzhenica]|uniref:Uncharacterized protein n=1 Tax=Apostasia shenzhenica TaxID=1088818 RepID=A0A2I0BGT4_9ASPA|nr:hypothetical protein AXF42_Ash004501 [Apostasia shenzhenica]